MSYAAKTFSKDILLDLFQGHQRVAQRFAVNFAVTEQKSENRAIIKRGIEPIYEKRAGEWVRVPPSALFVYKG